MDTRLTSNDPFDPFDILLIMTGSDVDAKHAMDRCIVAVAHMIVHSYPIDSDDIMMLKDDVSYLRNIQPDDDYAIMCRRAFILFAIYIDPCVAARFAVGPDKSLAMLSDLRDRILPLIVPRYIDQLCQHPDQLVRLATTMHFMWGGESLDALRTTRCDDCVPAKTPTQ